MYIYKFEDTEKYPFFIITDQEGRNYRLEILNSNNILAPITLKTGGNLESIFLYPEDPQIKLNQLDIELKETVTHCLKTYLSENHKDLLYFIPDDVDNRSEARLRKFNIWFSTMGNDNFDFYKSKITYGKDTMYVAFIFCKCVFEISELESTFMAIATGETISK